MIFEESARSEFFGGCFGQSWRAAGAAAYVLRPQAHSGSSLSPVAGIIHPRTVLQRTGPNPPVGTMAFALQKSATGVKAGVSRARTVRVQAVADNVASARSWIAAWRNKQAAVANRVSWFPGSKLPAHLDGTLPGDFGFDPLGLGVDPAKLAWYQQAELVHCRFAMLGAAGVLFPELLHGIGLGGPAAATPWYDAGKFEYFADARTLFGIQMLLFAWAELRRLQDIRKPGSASQDPIFTNNKLPAGEVGYPGGIFDPLGYSRGDMKTLKVKEIKNGRLAMLGFAGFCAQALHHRPDPSVQPGRPPG